MAEENKTTESDPSPRKPVKDENKGTDDSEDSSEPKSGRIDAKEKKSSISKREENHIESDDEVEPNIASIADLHRDLSNLNSNLSNANAHTAMLYELANSGLEGNAPGERHDEAIAELNSLRGQVTAMIDQLEKLQSSIGRMRLYLDQKSGSSESETEKYDTQDPVEETEVKKKNDLLDEVIKNTKQ